MKIIEKKSPYNYTETVKRFKENLPEIQFGILYELPFHDVLESKGFPLEQKSIMFEVCKPSLAQGVLKADNGFSYFLPCKCVIREDDGQVFAGFLTSREEMVERGGAEAEKVIEQVEAAIKSVIDKVVGE